MEYLRDIKDRSKTKRRRFDHIGWRGVCKRCGLVRNLLGNEVYYTLTKGVDNYDPRDEDMECSAPNCKGVIKFLGRMNEERALHLSDITRRI